MKRILLLATFAVSMLGSSVHAQAMKPVRPRVVVNVNNYDSAKLELDKIKKKLDKHQNTVGKCANSYQELEKIVDSGVKKHPSLMERMIDLTSDCLAVDTPELADAKTMTEDLGMYALNGEDSLLTSGWTKDQFKDFSKRLFKLWDRFKAIDGKRPLENAVDVLLRKAQNLQ